MKKLTFPLRISLAVLLSLAAAVPAVFLFFHNPWQTIYPPCIIRGLTGLDCPGCGMTRALYSLLHLRFYQAFRYNMLIYPFLAALGAGWLALTDYLLRGKSFLRGIRLHKYVWVGVIGVVALFTVLRNIPAEPFVYFKV